SRKMDRAVRVKVFSQYGNLIEEFSPANIDGAFFGSFPYVLAHAKFGVEPLARPRSLDGTSTYCGLIFVRKDSGIRTIRDMQGKRFAFVDKATMAGYLFPLEYFKKQGIRNYRAYFREVYFTGTHEDAIYDVLNRKTEVGSAKNTVYERLAREDRRIGNELIILERSPEVPENVLAVRKDLQPAVKAKLREVLLNMENDEEGRKVLKAFGALGFIEAKDEEYGSVVSYAKHLGLKLATYDYMNTP
ncbi:MAG TPA: phosphate/phosphite/phosphonate ABC transporter substrate-binding protein, partial [Thermodesulfovibrionales bacterium]|nr:phosphate/phosphite/phosphonate ABC transporter substrate-binding protein [Thermodesulfovibrionales bacterium]